MRWFRNRCRWNHPFHVGNHPGTTAEPPRNHMVPDMVPGDGSGMVPGIIDHPNTWHGSGPPRRGAGATWFPEPSPRLGTTPLLVIL